MANEHLSLVSSTSSFFLLLFTGLVYIIRIEKSLAFWSERLVEIRRDSRAQVAPPLRPSLLPNALILYPFPQVLSLTAVSVRTVNLELHELCLIRLPSRL